MLNVAVVTPYFDESLDVLEACHASVLEQTYSVRHVMVSDGIPRDEIEAWDIEHIKLPFGHDDFGSTARLIGAYHAIGSGADAIAFLDADNWYSKVHIENVMRLRKETDADFISTGRMLCRLNGEPMGECPDIDPEIFIDTNCMSIFRNGFFLLNYWLTMPEYGHVIGDRIFYYYIRQSNIKRCHVSEATVNYRCDKIGPYLRIGEKPDDEVKRPPDYPDYMAAHEQWLRDGFPSLYPKQSRANKSN